jgi:hypothetical protein
MYLSFKAVKFEGRVQISQYQLWCCERGYEMVKLEIVDCNKYAGLEEATKVTHIKDHLY